MSRRSGFGTPGHRAVTPWAYRPRFVTQSGSLARPEGFEPPTRRLEICRSIRLSYGRAFVNSNTASRSRRKSHYSQIIP